MVRYTAVCSIVVMSLAGCASTGEWRGLRIDGSSEAAFDESVASFQQQLSTTRRQLFEYALTDIWVTGVTDAAATNDTYTANEYFGTLNGLRYREVLDLVDRDQLHRYRMSVAGSERALPRDPYMGLGPPHPFPNPTAQGFSETGRGGCSTCTAW